MKTSDSISAISKALAAALPGIQNAVKDSKNPHFRSDYASLKSVLDTAKPVLAEHGVVVLQAPGWDGESVTLTQRLLHESGEWIEATAGTPVAKADPQGVGSAITYLRRYVLAAMVGITQEDDDGNTASYQPSASKTMPSGSASPRAAGGAATPKQVALIEMLAKSSALTEEERDAVRGRLARGMTMPQASEAIEWLKAKTEDA